MAVRRWEKIGETEVVTDTKYKQFTRDRWINPKTGKTEEYYFLGTEFGKTPTIIFAITSDHQVIAVKQFRHGAEEVLIEVPGGNPKTPEDTPEFVALKELEEETGFRPGEIIVLGEEPMWFDPCSYKVGFYPVMAKDCEKVGDQALDETEDMECVLIPLDEWINMIHSGAIRDSKTIAVTFLALPHLGINIKTE